MKKLLFLFLLLPIIGIAQVGTGQEQGFDYGLRNLAPQTVSTPTYICTQGLDGTIGITAAANIEKTANKQNSLNYDGTATKYPTVDGVNDWTRKMARVATKTGLLDKNDTFNLIPLTNSTLRIAAVTSAMFWNELFVSGTAPNAAIKSFAQLDYPLTQLVTATGGNVNVNPLTTDGKYVRYIGYDKNGNVYTALNNFASNNDILQLGFITVLKTGSTVEFLDGTAGPRNVFPQPNMASNTDFDKVAATVTNITAGKLSGASIFTNSGTITGISINWKSASNPTNSDPIDVFNYTGVNPAAFRSIDPSFLAGTAALSTHTLWTDTESGIAINSSFWNTTTGARGTMANGSASLKRILVGVRGSIYVQEAEFPTTACYSSLSVAIQNMWSHTFSDAIVPPGVAYEIARVAYVKGATAFTNDTQFYLENKTSTGSGGGSTPVADATTLTKGIIKLAGDLGGTADLPTVKGFAMVVNIKDFGAIGDGITNNTAFIQNAIDSANDGAIVWIPKGIYLTNNLIVQNKTNVRFTGGGTLKLNTGSNDAIFTVFDSYRPTFDNLNFIGISDSVPAATGTKSMAIYCYQSSFLDIHNCDFTKFNHYAIRTQNMNGGTFTEGSKIYNNIFHDFSFDEGTATDQYAIFMGVDGEYSQIYENSFFRIVHAINFQDGANGVFRNNVIMKSKSLSSTIQYTDRALIYAASVSNNAKIRILDNQLNHNETNTLLMWLGGGGAFPQYTIHGNHAIVVGDVNSSRLIYLDGIKGAIITNNVLDPSFGASAYSGDVFYLNNCDNAQFANNEIYEGYHSIALINSTAKLGNNNFRMWYGTSPIYLSGTSSVDGHDGLKYILKNGNVLLNTTIDNGIDKLQVNGTITSSAATSSNQVVIKSQLDAAIRPYKVYTALISQSSTSNPTVKVLENTLGGTITWSRTSTGIYGGTLTGAFTTDKTFVTIGRSTSRPMGFTSTDSGINTINIQTQDTSGIFIDGMLFDTSIEIRVYN